ncbi:asparaginase [Oceanobacter mangrovi]|uniref:asparaginase n=1 Tax=Oceanobacter mangrovi TaxID=2862510 RepID=UPI001C8E6FC6|nr:asparaginase [Oceanobacter mangrovi]
MKTRILILYTGGTFGMVPSDQGYQPAAGIEQRIRASLPADQWDSLPDFEVRELAPLIDSSNLVPAHWNRIAGELQASWQQYDGFVVIHGTDTMAYTASVLSYMLKGQDKAVIVTGSQIPLGILGSDAVNNFTNSLLFATQKGVREVAICFAGRLLRGNRSRKLKSTQLDAFDSLMFPYLGESHIGIKLNSHLLLKEGRQEFTNPAFNDNAVHLITLYPGFCDDILTAILAKPQTKSIIIQTYGVGNPPDAHPTLMQQLQKATAAGIVVVNLSQCPWGEVLQGSYSTAVMLNNIGVIGGIDITPEAAFTKLYWLIAKGLTGEDLKAGFIDSVAGEIDTRD